jgi:apolipoprotein N-acyltransferase
VAFGLPAMPDSIQGASLLTPMWRWLVAGLQVLSAVNLPFSLVAALLMRDPPVTPGILMRSLLVFSALPALAAWATLRFLRVTMEATEEGLRLERPGMRIELPAHALRAALPWRVPLPGPGLSLRIAGGETFPHGLQSRDLDPLLDLLARLDEAATEEARRHPTLVFARARARRRPVTATRLALKFTGFAILPTAVLFNLHQHIAYGGTLGQYYLYGLDLRRSPGKTDRPRPTAARPGS